MSGMTLALKIAIALLAINCAAFVAFGDDKSLAQTGSRRIPESTLLWLALLGGSPGAIAGQRYFRHKTQKEPFRSTLYAIAALQGAAVATLIFQPEWLIELTRLLA